VRRRRLAALSASLAFASGCIAYRGDESVHPASWPTTPGANPKTISLVLMQTPGSYNGQEGGITTEGWAKLEEATRDAYAESTLFAEVRQSYEEADLRAEVEVFSETDAFPRVGNRWLGGLPVFGTIIPATLTNVVHMHTTFKNFAGETLAEVDSVETMTFWTQVFLVLAMPFAGSPEQVGHDALRDLSRYAIATAHESGAL
jgi:hypothetical protein